MKFEFFVSTVAQAKKLILALSILCALLIVSNVVLGFLSVSLSHRHQIVLVPMNLKGEANVGNDFVSQNYLKATALSFIDLRLNFDPDTIKSNHRLILQYVYPPDFGQIKATLEKEAASVIKQGLSSSFAIRNISIDPESLTVIVTGDLMRSLNTQNLPEARATFRLQFINDDGLLGLTSFSELKKKKTSL